MREPNYITLSPSELATLRTDFGKGSEDGNYVAAYTDLSNFVAQDNGNGNLDANSVFWYNNACLINNNAYSPSGYFIRDVTDYGRRIDGLKGGDTQKVSNDIAKKVIGDVLKSGRIVSLPALLKVDIGVAIKGFQMTIGGWGGSFYYWDQANPDTNSTVGATILASNTEFDKFIAANGATLADSLVMHPGAYLAQVLQYGLKEIFGGPGAEVPFSIALQLAAREIEVSSGDAIVGSPNLIYNSTYGSADFMYSGGSWYDLAGLENAQTFGISIDIPEVTDGNALSYLATERSYRLAHQNITGYSNTELNGPQSHDKQSLQASAPPAASNVGVVAYSDESYLTTTWVNDGNYGAIESGNYYSASGSLVISTEQQVGGNDQFVDLWNQQATAIAANELFSVPTGSSEGTLSLASFSSTGGSWSQDNMSFLGDGQTVSSVSITNANGSSETYSPAASGYWSESLFDNVGNLTETLQYGEIYNSQTGTYMLGTQEVQYPSGAMTFWPAGDPDAPSAVLPSGAPTDLASAQTLWTSMVSADKGVGT